MCGAVVVRCVLLTGCLLRLRPLLVPSPFLGSWRVSGLGLLLWSNPCMCCAVRRLGYKVALLDADVGLRNLDLLLGLENRVLYTAIDILEGDCRCVCPSWQLYWTVAP